MFQKKMCVLKQSVLSYAGCFYGFFFWDLLFAHFVASEGEAYGPIMRKTFADGKISVHMFPVCKVLIRIFMSLHMLQTTHLFSP